MASRTVNALRGYHTEPVLARSHSLSFELPSSEGMDSEGSSPLTPFTATNPTTSPNTSSPSHTSAPSGASTPADAFNFPNGFSAPGLQWTASDQQMLDFLLEGGELTLNSSAEAQNFNASAVTSWPDSELYPEGVDPRNMTLDPNMQWFPEDPLHTSTELRCSSCTDGSCESCMSFAYFQQALAEFDEAFNGAGCPAQFAGVESELHGLNRDFSRAMTSEDHNRRATQVRGKSPLLDFSDGDDSASPSHQLRAERTELSLDMASRTNRLHAVLAAPTEQALDAASLTHNLFDFTATDRTLTSRALRATATATNLLRTASARSPHAGASELHYQASLPSDQLLLSGDFMNTPLATSPVQSPPPSTSPVESGGTSNTAHLPTLADLDAEIPLEVQFKLVESVKRDPFRMNRWSKMCRWQDEHGRTCNATLSGNYFDIQAKLTEHLEAFHRASAIGRPELLEDLPEEHFHPETGILSLSAPVSHACGFAACGQTFGDLIGLRTHILDCRSHFDFSCTCDSCGVLLRGSEWQSHDKACLRSKASRWVSYVLTGKAIAEEKARRE